MYSDVTAKEILETAIDSLVRNFCEQPYIHRCEHSLHCELYSMLTVHRAFQGLYSIRGTDYKTALVHKEWPETEARPDKSGRRGNFDIAILNPETLHDEAKGKKSGEPTRSISDFYEGRFKPAYVVEIGLNYYTSHLEADFEKLKNSGFKSNAYLVHLWQPHRGIREKELNELDVFMKKCELNLAVAVFTAKDTILLKSLSDKEAKLHKNSTK